MDRNAARFLFVSTERGLARARGATANGKPPTGRGETWTRAIEPPRCDRMIDPLAVARAEPYDSHDRTCAAALRAPGRDRRAVLEQAVACLPTSRGSASSWRVSELRTMGVGSRPARRPAQAIGGVAVGWRQTASGLDAAATSASPFDFAITAIA